MVDIDDICEPEWVEWYRMTPAERWKESEKLWALYLALGGSLDPEPDTQSPFFDPKEADQSLAEQRKIERLMHRQWRMQLLRRRN